MTDWIRKVLLSAPGRLSTGFLAAVVATILAKPADAALSSYESRAVPSASGEFLLVLLTPEDGRASRKEYNATVQGAGWSLDEIRRHNDEVRRQVALEAKYPGSGLYRNDGSTEMLWPIQYLPRIKSVFVSDDGDHLVVAYLNWDEYWSDRGAAVEFYSRGQWLAGYREDELLSGYFGRLILDRSIGVAEPTCTSAQPDECAGVFQIETNWGDIFRFDLATGRLVDSRQPWVLKVFMVLTGASTAAIGWWLWRHSKGRRRRAR